VIDVTSLTTPLHEHRELVWWIAALSGVVFVGSLVSVPWMVVRIPSDYFVSKHRPQTYFASHHPLLRWTFWATRNVVGVMLILAGVAMLVLPGQGLLTLAVGVFLMDFPGKHRLERRIIRFGPIWKSIRWLRRRSNVDPLRVEPEHPAATATGDDVA
jgi:hypothetical protein